MVRTLLPCLKGSDIRTVKLAVRRVGMMRDTRYVKDIVRVIARSDQTVEEEKDVAIECKESLKMVGESAYESLVELTNDPDEKVQLAAIEGLGLTGSPQSVGPLCKMLGSSKEEIKVAALQSLIWIGIVTEEVEKLSDSGAA